MANLTQTTPLNNFRKPYNGLTIKEISGFEIVSIAFANSADKTPSKMEAFLGAALPEPSTWVSGKKGRIIWTSPDQYFLITETENDRLDEELTVKFEGQAYFTLQTDGWACLQVSGDAAYEALERFVSLDIRKAPIGFSGRSTAHHMSVMILKTAEHSFILLTPRSSSDSFLHALEDVVENIN